MEPVPETGQHLPEPRNADSHFIDSTGTTAYDPSRDTADLQKKLIASSRTSRFNTPSSEINVAYCSKMLPRRA